MQISEIAEIDFSEYCGLELGHCVVDCVEDDGIPHYRRLSPSETDMLKQVVVTTIYGYNHQGFADALVNFDPTVPNKYVRSLSELLLLNNPSLARWGVTDYLIEIPNKGASMNPV